MKLFSLICVSKAFTSLLLAKHGFGINYYLLLICICGTTIYMYIYIYIHICGMSSKSTDGLAEQLCS